MPPPHRPAPPGAPPTAHPPCGLHPPTHTLSALCPAPPSRMRAPLPAQAMTRAERGTPKWACFAGADGACGGTRAGRPQRRVRRCGGASAHRCGRWRGSGPRTNHGCPQEPLGGPPTVWHGLKMDTGRTPLFREDRKLAGVAHFCFAGPDRGFAPSVSEGRTQLYYTAHL